MLSRSLRALCALTIAASFTWNSPAYSASFRPDLTWRTLVTEHYRITFHGGEEQLAEEIAHLGEEIWVELTNELASEPQRPVEIVLVDHTDSANGYAMTVPVNTIVIFVTAPNEDSTLSRYEDWSDAILTHELTHILHIDTVEGLPRLLRGVLGRIISVNRVSPGWIVEGYATFQETRYTNGGRGRSNTVDMIKRMSVLEDQFPPLGNMDGWQTAPPAGNLRYLYGQDFIDYIVNQSGEMTWTDWVHIYGGSIPYYLPARRVFGQSFQQHYWGWKAEMEDRYNQQKKRIESEGLTDFRILTDGEERCAGPTFSPDGHRIVWACNNPHTGSDVFLADGDGTNIRIELENRYASDFSWRKDSNAFAFSSMHVVDRFNLYSDVYLHPIGGGVESLTSGKRARNPVFSPTGEQLLIVTNKTQNNNLATLTVDRTFRPLTEYTDHTQISTPRYSPDGQYVVMSMWRDGQRDIWIASADGALVRRVTADSAHDQDPLWSPDGRRIYFSSDRTGVFNIYAIDLETEHLWQVTNVLGGAFRPSVNPEQTAMVFEAYSHNGADVAWMDLDSKTWTPRGVIASPIEYGGRLAALMPNPPIELDVTPPPNLDEHDEEALSPRKQRQRERIQRRDERRGAKTTSALTRETALPLTEDPLRLEGLDGLGGPYAHLGSLPGRWGLPGEGPDQGEFPEQPTSGPDSDNPEQANLEAPEEEDYPFSFPVERYKPLPSLLPPRYVLPGIYRSTFGYMGILSTAGSDVLRRYLYSAWVSYRTDSQFVGWGTSFALNRWVPIYSAGIYTQTAAYGDIYQYHPPEEGGTWMPGLTSIDRRYWDKRLRAYAQASYSLNSYQSIFGRWSATLHQPLEPICDVDAESTDGCIPNVFRPYLPTRGFLSSIGGGWRKAKGNSYGESISPEDARITSFVAKIAHPWIGSYTLGDQDERLPFAQLQVTGEWREYRTLPWGHNHVLAARGAVGLSAGDTMRYGSFRLGGSWGESAYYTLPDEVRSLRGFPFASAYGDGFFLGSLEYRLPIWRLDRGVSTIPFFARYLSAAAFMDIGNAFDTFEEIGSAAQQSLIGVGAEIKGTAIMGWGVPLQGRLGYAFAVHGSGGYSIGSPYGAYLRLGSSF